MEIATRVKELGQLLVDDYTGLEPLLVAPLKSSVVFLADLSRALPIVHGIDLIELAAYSEGVGGGVRLLKDLDVPISDRHVVIVEDVVDRADAALPRAHARAPQPGEPVGGDAPRRPTGGRRRPAAALHRLHRPDELFAGTASIQELARCRTCISSSPRRCRRRPPTPRNAGRAVAVAAAGDTGSPSLAVARSSSRRSASAASRRRGPTTAGSRRPTPCPCDGRLELLQRSQRPVAALGQLELAPADHVRLVDRIGTRLRLRRKGSATATTRDGDQPGQDKRDGHRVGSARRPRGTDSQPSLLTRVQPHRGRGSSRKTSPASQIRLTSGFTRRNCTVPSLLISSASVQILAREVVGADPTSVDGPEEYAFLPA